MTVANVSLDFGYFVSIVYNFLFDISFFWILYFNAEFSNDIATIFAIDAIVIVCLKSIDHSRTCTEFKGYIESLEYFKISAITVTLLGIVCEGI